MNGFALHDLCCYRYDLTPEQIAECVRRYTVEYVGTTGVRIRDNYTGGIPFYVSSTDYRVQRRAVEDELVKLCGAKP